MLGDPNRGKPLEIASEFNQTVELVSNGNQQSFYTVDVDRLAFAVADEAPFKLQIVSPKCRWCRAGR